MFSKASSALVGKFESEFNVNILTRNRYLMIIAGAMAIIMVLICNQTLTNIAFLVMFPSSSRENATSRLSNSQAIRH